MKTALYVATVARTYRKALDDFAKGEEVYKANMDWYHAEIAKCTYRKFTTGFYFKKPDEDAQIYDNNTYVNEYIYLGTVADIDSNGFAVIEQKNKFCVGDPIEIMKPNGDNIVSIVNAMYDKDGVSVDSCPHPGQEIHLDLSITPDKYDILRVSNEIAKR